MSETYLYSLMSSGLGILIVFIALVVLSVLMVLLKRFFGTKEERPEEDTRITPTAPQVESEGEDLEWITAAVAAYIIKEGETLGAPSAESWQPGTEERTDPWVATPVLRTRV